MDSAHVYGLVVLVAIVGGLWIMAKVYGPDFDAERETRNRNGVGNGLLDNPHREF